MFSRKDARDAKEDWGSVPPWAGQVFLLSPSGFSEMTPLEREGLREEVVPHSLAEAYMLERPQGPGVGAWQGLSRP